MTATHSVIAGFEAACEHPESPRAGRDYSTDVCRACLVAAIATAVNRPTRRVRTVSHPEGSLAPQYALRRVRALLDECDPLRVRAEQALLPLVAS